jgi:hypothetical protein
MHVQKLNQIHIWFLTSLDLVLSVSKILGFKKKIRQMIFILWHSAGQKLNSAVKFERRT